MKQILFLFLVWVFIINIFALAVLNRLTLSGDSAYTWQDQKAYSQPQSWNIINIHAHWDSDWYLDIAKNGYSYSGGLSNAAFFPLYPYIIHLIPFGSPELAGWITSLSFLFLSLLYLYKIVSEFHPDINPYRPLTFLLVFPTAFFLNAVYTESLFLFLSIASFYYSLKKNFILSGIFGFFSAITRITGVLLFIPLVWEFIQAYRSKQASLKYIWSLFLIPFGTFAFFFFHYLKFGNFFLWFKIESDWGRSFKLNNDHFSIVSNPGITNLSLDILFVIFALSITYLVFKKLRTSYGLYMLSTLLVALGSGTTMSINRYILVLFPMYILLAKTNEVTRQIISFIFILLLAFYTTLFVNNYWAG